MAVAGSESWGVGLRSAWRAASRRTGIHSRPVAWAANIDLSPSPAWAAIVSPVQSQSNHRGQSLETNQDLPKVSRIRVNLRSSDDQIHPFDAVNNWIQGTFWGLESCLLKAETTPPCSSREIRL